MVEMREGVLVRVGRKQGMSLPIRRDLSFRKILTLNLIRKKFLKLKLNKKCLKLKLNQILVVVGSAGWLPVGIFLEF
jgi:hypothetical protein